MINKKNDFKFNNIKNLYNLKNSFLFNSILNDNI